MKKFLKKITNRTPGGKFFIFLLVSSFLLMACKKEKESNKVTPSSNLALDSIRATKKTIVAWEEIYITANARGKNLSFAWRANHGSMAGKDSVTVKYWACPSCVGLNTIECKVSNEYGSITDTIMIRVNK